LHSLTNVQNLQFALDSFVTKIKDVGHTVVEGASKVPTPARSPASCYPPHASQVGTMAVDGAKNVGASAVAIGAKAADGAKSVGASAVVRRICSCQLPLPQRDI
jgi:hypothetical protein